ncbi:hypothetical protein [Pantoea sp. C2G6]|uniref:hypothetical protein n=1 Tax=Pantoea sp. C2G6 TaxID=3243084 RepID=UPI003ED9A142
MTRWHHHLASGQRAEPAAHSFCSGFCAARSGARQTQADDVPFLLSSKSQSDRYFMSAEHATRFNENNVWRPMEKGNFNRFSSESNFIQGIINIIADAGLSHTAFQ